jgi:diguanylate cyclase (GGDEF)-like protein/PAS domain S-box-containing protein
VARAVIAHHEDNSLSFAGNMTEGDIVHFGYGDAFSIINNSLSSQKKLLNQSIQTIFLYSCMARRRFMPDLIEKEIKPFSNIAPTVGFFTYGEFFSKELLNQTLTILALSESILPLTKISHVDSLHLNDYQKSIRSLSHLLNATINDLNEENKKLMQGSLELHTKEESLRLAQEIGHFGSWDIDLITKEAVLSQESYNIYKIDPSVKPVLDTFLSQVIDEDKPKTLKIMEEMRDGKIKSIELHVKRYDNNEIINVLINGKMILDDNGTPIRMIGTTLDITEISKLREQNKEQAQILEQIHDSVVTTDLNGIITHWNNGATKIFGYSSLEVIGKPLSTLYAKSSLEQITQMFKTVLKTGTCKGENVNITKSEELIHTDTSLSLLKNENGEVIGVIGFSQDITQKKEIEKKLQKQTELLNHQAYHDHLTNLPNRMLFDDRLIQSIANAKRHNESFALLFIDLDNFKEINDTLGHHIGDKVLQLVSKKLSTCVRVEDSLSRLGGDEFTIILQNIKMPTAAADVAQKLIDIINKKLMINNYEIYLSASIGISIYPKDSSDKNDMIKFADSAMYKAKENGKNNYQFYSATMTTIAFEKVTLQNSMRTAIINQEFVVYYQPQINAKKGVITGMEALVRWQHPSIGLIAPIKFIPLAEESGFIVHLDNYVMKQAMIDFVSWYKMGLNPGILSLNLSIKQLANNDFIHYLTTTSKETGFNLNWLEFEITETQMMQDPLASIEKLNIISDMGIEIAIDDFGTGYSSLAYLKRLPVDKLKIDKSFVDGLPEDEEDCAISKAVIALAKSLNLKIIAEGVESIEQQEFLLQNGCDHIQGYYHSKPLPKMEIEYFLQTPLI